MKANLPSPFRLHLSSLPFHSFAQESISAGNGFVFSSCDFVDHSVCPENKDDPRSHTNQREPKILFDSNYLYGKASVRPNGSLSRL